MSLGGRLEGLEGIRVRALGSVDLQVDVRLAAVDLEVDAPGFAFDRKPLEIEIMATKSSSPRAIPVRLIHDGAQPGAPLSEPLRFGLQDSGGEVHSGVPRSDGALQFDFALEVKGDAENGPPIFKGVFAHGPPASRFVYLSWKRLGTHEHPWGWRIKMPLSAIGWREVREALGSNLCLVADVRGRRPHASQPVEWKLAPLEDP